VAQRNSLALLSIPAYLGERLNDIVVEEMRVDKLTPYIHVQRVQESLVEARCDVYADGTLVCSTAGVANAFLVLICTFFAFNIKYPKSNKTTLTFIAKYMCGVNEGGAKEPKVLSFVTKLHKG
jgi:hypothetical protein